jgi:hypothetical protein
MRDLKDFYVIFGGLLINYHLHVRAYALSVVWVWMKEQSGLKHWIRVQEKKPEGTMPLQVGKVELLYNPAKDV